MPVRMVLLLSSRWPLPVLFASRLFSCCSYALMGIHAGASLEDVRTPWTHGVKYIVKTTRKRADRRGLDDYRDADGENRLGLLIGIVEGEMLVVAAPFARRVPDLDDTARLALLDLVNEATRNYKLAHAGWDPNDEVTAHVRFDEQTLPGMLERCIGNVIEFFERYGSRIDEVLNTDHHRARGRSHHDDRAEMMERFARYQAELEDGV